MRNVLAALFWTLLVGFVLWNAPILPWSGILELAGLMLGLAMLWGDRIGREALTARLPGSSWLWG